MNPEKTTLAVILGNITTICLIILAGQTNIFTGTLFLVDVAFFIIVYFLWRKNGVD